MRFAIGKLIKALALRQTLRRLLKLMGDLKRLVTRAGAGQSRARNLVAIVAGLMRLPRVAKQLEGPLDQTPEWIEERLTNEPALIQLSAIIRNHLIDNPPLSLSEGGVIVTNDDVLCERLQLIRNHAEAVVGPKGVSDISNMIGHNYRLGEIEAAIGIEQLKKLDGLVHSRKMPQKS